MDDPRVRGRRWIGLIRLGLPALLVGLGLAGPSARADDTRPAVLPPVEAVRLDEPGEKDRVDPKAGDGKSTREEEKPLDKKAGEDKDAQGKKSEDKGADREDMKKEDKAEAIPEVMPSAAGHVIDLATCRQIALVRQPAMAAARASLATAQARAAGLQRLPQVPILARDLPIRRQQACLGVSIAAACLEQTQWDTLYNVTRCYLAAVYARQQLDFADQAIKELRELRRLTGEVDDKEEEAEQLTLYLEVVIGRREAALQGIDRALAALREAMGLEPGVSIQVLDRRLPDVPVTVSRDEVVQLALSRRGELVQASLGAQVTCREVEAQALRSFHPIVRTFASGSDIHATPIPTADRGAEYRPGALAPEMPPFLVGDRDARVGQAQALTARANTMVDKVRGLITLEAEDAYFRYLEDARKLPRLREAAALARRRADRLTEDAKNPDVKPRFNEATAAGAMAAQLRVETNETHYQLLLNLAALERVTAGGFSSGLEHAHADGQEASAPAPGEAAK